MAQLLVGAFLVLFQHHIPLEYSWEFRPQCWSSHVLGFIAFSTNFSRSVNLSFTFSSLSTKCVYLISTIFMLGCFCFVKNFIFWIGCLRSRVTVFSICSCGLLPLHLCLLATFSDCANGLIVAFSLSDLPVCWSFRDSLDTVLGSFGIISGWSFSMSKCYSQHALAKYCAIIENWHTLQWLLIVTKHYTSDLLCGFVVVILRFFQVLLASISLVLCCGRH